MSNIVITQYSNHYKDQIISLILSIQTQEFGVQISIEDQPDLNDIQQFYLANNGNFWVALNDNNVIGTIAIINIGKGMAVLRKMFVDDRFRGKEKGVAKLLLEAAINWCKENKFTEIYLGTTAEYLAAHRFYEKNGFIEIPKKFLPKEFPIMKVDSKFYKCQLT